MLQRTIQRTMRADYEPFTPVYYVGIRLQVIDPP
jgi:hypothetical protein